MGAVLRVVNWSQHFENNRTKELKVMTWLPIPTKQDGDGYTELLDHPEGAAHFGAWIAIIQVAAKCDERGTLLRHDRRGLRLPHDAQSLSRITRIQEATIAAAVARLVEIGWLEYLPETHDLQESSQLTAAIPQIDATTPQEPAGYLRPPALAIQDRTEQKRTEEVNCSCAETAKPSSPPAPVLHFPCDGKPPEWNLTEAHIQEWRGLYPSLDILAECRGALAWIKAKPTRRKTARGMKAFLVSWFAKSIERGGNYSGARAKGKETEYYRGQPIIPLSSVTEPLPIAAIRQRALDEPRALFQAGKLSREELDRRGTMIRNEEDREKLWALHDQWKAERESAQVAS